MAKSKRSVWKDLKFDHRAKKDLARFITTLQGGRDENKFKTDEFLAEAFGVYYIEGSFNPNPISLEDEDTRREFKGSERLRQRMLEEVDCGNEKCQLFLDGKHERSESFSRKQIHTWIAEAKKHNAFRLETVDWKDSVKLSEFGIDVASRQALRRICDAIRKASANGEHHTFYDALDYKDLATLQWVIQGYPELKIFDQLAIMDVYQSLGVENEDTSTYDDWLAYRPWESDSSMLDYIAAVDSDKVKKIDKFYPRNFPRPEYLFRYHLPTQLIDTFVPIEGRRGRDTDVLGIHAFDVFTISENPSPDDANGDGIVTNLNKYRAPSTLTLLHKYLDERKGGDEK